MIDVQNRKVREIGNEEFVACERSLKLFVRFRLIILVVQIEHSDISRPQIDDPTEADIPLHQSHFILTELPKIVVTRNHDPLFQR